MRTIEDLKKSKIDIENGNIIDENGNTTKIMWSEQDGDVCIEHTISEEIEPATIDGITYVNLQYMSGKGLVISDETQKSTICVKDLISNNKTEEVETIKENTSKSQVKTETYIEDKFATVVNNTIETPNSYKNGSVVIVKGKKYKLTKIKEEQLTNDEMEICFGSWVLEDDIVMSRFDTMYTYKYEEIYV